MVGVYQLAEQVKAGHTGDAAHIKAPNFAKRGAWEAAGATQASLLSLLKLLHLLLEVQLLRLIKALRREIARRRNALEKVLERLLAVCSRKALHACAQLPEPG